MTVAVETRQMPRANPRPPGPEERAARRIAWERARRGWSTSELARRMTEDGVPVNQSAIYKIEKGEPRRTISLDEAHSLVRVFGLRDIAELESVPDELISAELSSYLDELGQLDDAVRELQRRAAGLLRRVLKTADDIRPVVEYIGTDPPWAGLTELQAALGELAELILSVRDAVGELRPDGEH